MTGVNAIERSFFTLSASSSLTIVLGSKERPGGALSTALQPVNEPDEPYLRGLHLNGVEWRCPKLCS